MSSQRRRCAGYTLRKKRCRNLVSGTAVTCGRCKGTPPIPAVGTASTGVNVPYTPRHAEDRLLELLSEWGAVNLTGPRGIGKTTTAKLVGGTYYDLEDPQTAEDILYNTVFALAQQPKPVILDEWRGDPRVLWAVKRILDESGGAPGQFIVISSSGKGALKEGDQWPLARRAWDMPMLPMSVHELSGSQSEPFFKRASAGDFITTSRQMVLQDYNSHVIRGGYPIPAHGTHDSIKLANSALTDTQNADLPSRVSRQMFRRFLESFAFCSGSYVSSEKLAEMSEVGTKTAWKYRQLAQDAGLTYELPGWQSSPLSPRAYRRPKLLISDTAVWCALADVNATVLERYRALAGVWSETFVGQQLQAETGRAGHNYDLRHYRDSDGHEVDFVLEDKTTRRAIFIEVKASNRPTRKSAKHLIYLRNALKSKGEADRFAGGVVLHTGGFVASWGEKIWAAPLASLWS